jgi:hypothetical protein
MFPQQSMILNIMLHLKVLGHHHTSSEGQSTHHDNHQHNEAQHHITSLLDRWPGLRAASAEFLPTLETYHGQSASQAKILRIAGNSEFSDLAVAGMNGGEGARTKPSEGAWPRTVRPPLA